MECNYALLFQCIVMCLIFGFIKIAKIGYGLNYNTIGFGEFDFGGVYIYTIVLYC
jgi:hypothetical protein